jgi:hypothetical protein
MKKLYIVKLTLLILLNVIAIGSVAGQKTWYALNNVNRMEGETEIIGWANYDNWTEDPAAQVYSNPSLSIPADGDNIVIKPGKEITLPAGFVINAGKVTVDGTLYIDGATDAHVLSALRGSGRVYIRGSKLPTGDLSHFTSAGPGAGTVVLRGDGPIAISEALAVYNLEIDMSASDKMVTLSNDVTVSGNLNVKRGQLMMGGTTARTLDVKRNVFVQISGHIGVIADAAYHNMIVWGDFKNYGSVKLSNALQYSPATNGAMRLTFKGATNNDFVINGSTELYRLFVEKGASDFYTLSVTSNDVAHFKLMGPYEKNIGIEPGETIAWQSLPLVIMKGTLKLGTNIVIDKLGYLRSGTAPNEFFIPDGAGLWINGAQVNSGVIGSPETWQANGTGISVGGIVRISAGSLTNPPASSGITYRGPSSVPSKLIVEGGEIFTTQLRAFDENSFLNYKQSDGVIDFYTRSGAAWTSPVFNLPNAEQVFEMSGGTMIFRVANNRGADSHGIQILSGEGNHNVTGGTVEIYTPIDNDFQILSSVPFYDVRTVKGLGNHPVVFREHWSYPNVLNILNALEVGANTTVNAGSFVLFLGGDLILDGAFSLPTGTIKLNGSSNVTLANNTSSVFSINSLDISKINADAIVALAGTNNFSLGTLTLTKGDLDLGDKNLSVTSEILLHNGDILASSTGFVQIANNVQLYSSRGKENSFGSLTIASGKNVSLMSHALAKRVDFLGNSIFDLGSYNLEIQEADYAAVTGWGTSKMFKTAGKGSDGGLTLNFKIPASSVGIQALFPIGSTFTEYSPAVVKTAVGNPVMSSGALTVIPVNSAHPATDPSKTSDVIAYYWRTRVQGFTELENNKIRLEFTSSKDLKNLKGAFLNGLEWQMIGYKYGNGAKTLIFDSGTYGPYPNLVDADYTAGLDNGNGKIPIAGVRVYMSTGNHNWHSSLWSDDEGRTNVGPPSSSDIAVILSGHTVTIAQNSAVASQVQVDGTLFVQDGKTGHAIEFLKGIGRIAFQSNSSSYRISNLIAGDYTEFINSPDAIVEYTGTGGYGLAEVSKIPYYPNLHISGGTTNVKVHRNDGSLRVKGDLVINDAPLKVDGGWGQVIEIGGDLIVNSSEFSLASAGNTHTFIDGDIRFTGQGTLSGSAGNNLSLKGNIELGDGTINTSSERWFFVGDQPSVFTGNNLNDASKAFFHRITINKPEGVTVEFQTPFTISAAANGASDQKPMVLLSGIVHLNSAGLDLILNSGNEDFQIPSTSTLIVDGKSKVRASGSNSSLFLDGALVVDNGGEFLWEGSGGNHVKYSASGFASVWIGIDARFHVGSQLFRNADGGILNFTQANATSDVQIATVNAPLPQKGVFEILNSGSSFVQSEENSVIKILRGQSGSNPVPSVLFNPDESSIALGSKLVTGDSADANDITVYAEKALGGLDVVANSSVELLISPLTLNGSLNVGAGSTFAANDLDVTLKGDLQVDGTYMPGINTTYFSGSGAQLVSGLVDFYNLSKSAGVNTLTIDGISDVQVVNNLVVEKGSIVTGDHNLVVKGNAAVALGTTVGGIELKGGDLQLLSGGGNIGRLVINNNQNVMVPSQPDAISITSKLVLDEGVLDIGSNLMQLGKEVVVEDGIGGRDFSENNMIQTFLSFTDAGIRKYFPAISSPTTFIYPIGSQNKYTPVILTIEEITSGNGYIRVKAANERHISVIDNPETAMVEPDHVLKYYWTVDAKDIAGFRAKVNMQAYANDVTPPSEGDTYIVARILANNDLWNKLNETAKSEGENMYFDNGSSKLVFNGYFFNGTNDLGISGDYTAGVADAIPDKVPTYISVVLEGSWNDIDTWAVYNPETGVVGGKGVGIQENGPFGSIVYIRENVNITTNGRVAYRTEIEEGATLNIGSSINNRLGNVSGSGRLRVEGSSLPAGFYEQFAQPDGGIFEYGGTGVYTVLGGINSVNSIEFTGSGERKLSDGIIRVNGNMLVDGPTVSLGETTSLQIGKDLTFNSGSFDLGTDSRFEFNGVTQQTIGGALPFTGTNGIHNVTINNTGGVEIATALEVKTLLRLNNGVLNIGTGGSLYISNGSENASVGASATSFVNGPLKKAINGNESFNFPVGNEGRFGAFTINDQTTTGGDWIVVYHNSIPPSRDQKDAIAYISNNEYWEVISPLMGAEAAVSLRWDNESGVNADEFDVVSFEPDLTSALWTVVNKQSVDELGQSVTTASMAYNLRRYFSFGLQNMPVASDYTWRGLESADWFNPANWYGAKVPSAATPALITTVDIVTPGYWPVIEGGNIAQTNNLTIESGTTLTMNPGGKLTVNGDLSLAASSELVLDNSYGANGMASLLTHGQILGAGSTRIRLTTPPNQWFYLGSSIKNAIFSDFSAGEANIIINIYRANKWYGIKSGLAHRELRSMEGIVTNLLLEGAPDRLIEYTGALHTTAVSRVYDESGYNLLANPFPSFISWEDAAGWERPNVSGTIWYRGKIGGEMAFITYNRDALPNAKVALYPDTEVTFTTEEELSLIPPMQAVWISTSVPGVTMTVKPEARRHGIAGSMLKSSSASRYGDVIRIEAENEFSRDGAVLYFSNGSEEEVDKSDSEKYFNDSERIPEIYTRVGEKALSINGLPLLNDAARTIPLSVRNRIPGEVTMKFDLSYYYGHHAPYLEDKETGAFINLLQENTYTYSVSETGENHDRFALNFYYVTTDLETPGEDETDAGSAISIKSLAGKVLVSVGMDLLKDGNGTVEIYTIDGRKISEVPARSSRTLILLPHESGVYIIRAKFGNQVKSERAIGGK